MMPADEVQISAGIWFYRITGLIVPGCLVGIAASQVAFGPDTARRIWVFFLFFFILIGGLLYLGMIAPLKNVWLGEQGVRISNGWTEGFVPYESIASVRYTFSKNPRIVRVLIGRDDRSELGRGFDFVPKRSFIEWFIPFGPNAVVAELQQRIAEAQAQGKKHAPATGPAARLVMADDELDGPI